MKIKILLLVFFIILISWWQLSSRQWTRDKSELYTNEKGDIAILVVSHELRKKLYYKTHFFDSNISFKDVIDLETFKNLGKYYDDVFDNAYFVDKNRAYYYHSDSCGGNLEVDAIVR